MEEKEDCEPEQTAEPWPFVLFGLAVFGADLELRRHKEKQSILPHHK